MKLRAVTRQGKPPKIERAHEMYTPFGNQVTVITPGPQGGNNWQPMSFSPKTNMLYICAQSGTSGYTRTGRFLPKGSRGE